MKFACPQCNQHIDAPDELAGTEGACPTCGTLLVVPSPEPVPINLPSPKRSWTDSLGWFVERAFIAFVILLLASLPILGTGALIESVLKSHGRLSFEQGILLFFVSVAWGFAGILPLANRIRKQGMTLGAHSLTNLSLRVGDRSSTIIEERISGWITAFLSASHGFGAVLGFAVYPLIAAEYYGAEHTNMLWGASVVCIVGSLVIPAVSPRQGVGCLSIIFTMLVIGISFAIAGIRIPSDSRAWLFLLLLCMIFGVFASSVLSIPVGVVCAVAPTIGGRQLQTTKGNAYHPALALLHVLLFILASPLLATISMFSALGQINQKPAGKSDDILPANVA